MCLDGTGLANGDLNRNERKRNKAVCIYFEYPLASPNILKVTQIHWNPFALHTRITSLIQQEKCKCKYL